MESLIKKIKEKKELSGIADSVIKEALDNYFMKSNINLFKLSARGKKLVIKDIRAQLRKYAGRFQASLKERQTLLKENKITEFLAVESIFQILSRIVKK